MIAVIGAGRWGRNYLKTLMQLKVKVPWLYSRSEPTLREALKATGADAKATTNYDKILRDKSVTAVAIATSASTHYQFSKEALEAGKHVLVEKPVTLSSKEAEQLVRLAQAKKKILMAGHIHRFNPGIQKIRQGIDEGLFGKVRYIHSVTTSSGPVREDLNVMWDFAPHDITIASFLLGKYPESVSGNGAAFLRKDHYDAFTANMDFGNAFAFSFGSWLHPVKQRNIVVVGEKASAKYDDYAKKLAYYIDGSERKISFAKTHPLELEMRHFLECIESGRKPLTDGAEGLKAIKVIEAIERSAKENGKSVRLSLQEKHSP